VAWVFLLHGAVVDRARSVVTGATWCPALVEPLRGGPFGIGRGWAFSMVANGWIERGSESQRTNVALWDTRLID
jgi:hypothetical protein